MLKRLPYVVGAVAVTGILGGLIWVANASAESDRQRYAAEKREALEGECHDQAVLLATTAGSPDERNCPNRRHRMRVTIATTAGEEVGALVFCECQRDAPADGGK